jgi:outer membrane protein TolC
MRLERLGEVSRRIAERRKSNAELVRLRYDAGRENVGSALRAEAIYAQASFAARFVDRHLESQALRLARESGGEFTLPVHIEDDMEKMIPQAPPLTPDYALLAENTPNVQQLVKTAEAYKAAIVSAQSSVWPQLDGNANYGNTGDRASDLGNERLIGLKMTVPFFNGGKNVEGILKAKADYEAAEAAAVSQRDETVAKLAEAWALYADAIEDVDVKRKFLVASRKRAEIIRVQYTTGLASFQDFDIAEQENADSEKNYVESLANALVQQANWEQVKGESLEEAINEI